MARNQQIVNGPCTDRSYFDGLRRLFGSSDQRSAAKFAIESVALYGSLGVPTLQIELPDAQPTFAEGASCQPGAPGASRRVSGPTPGSLAAAGRNILDLGCFRGRTSDVT